MYVKLEYVEPVVNHTLYGGCSNIEVKGASIHFPVVMEPGSTKEVEISVGDFEMISKQVNAGFIGGGDPTATPPVKDANGIKVKFYQDAACITDLDIGSIYCDSYGPNGQEFIKCSTDTDLALAKEVTFISPGSTIMQVQSGALWELDREATWVLMG